ncbi:type II secretion system F family protein [Brevibacterium litoralis]|uniref:type II secretion system F family protein n=1 Tax=Brevibacterium litoralis TaxID=3138935 RepID=UPI0032EE3D27
MLPGLTGIGWQLPAALGVGALLGGGIFLLIAVLAGWPLGPARGAPTRRTARRSGHRTLASRLLWGLGGLLAVLLLTRWVVPAVLAGLIAAFWDRIVGGQKQEKVAIMRLEALATWTESLRDTIAGAVGLEQAIPASVSATPPVIRPQLNLLVDRLRVREPLPEALGRFADDLDDPSADMIVSALVLNARLRGPGLRDVLTALARSTRAELDMRRRIDASRAGIRRSVQIVMFIILGVMGGLAIFNRSYVEPYSTFLGQIVLVIVAAFILGGLAWLRKLGEPEPRERFLVRGAGDTEGPGTEGAATDRTSGGRGQGTSAADLPTSAAEAPSTSLPTTGGTSRGGDDRGGRGTAGDRGTRAKSARGTTGRRSRPGLFGRKRRR